MIMIAASLAGVLTVPIAGGRLSRLADLRLRHVWAVWASIAVQLAITSGGSTIPATVAEALHLCSYALSAWCIWANRSLPGLWLVAAGGAMNVLAIAANGGSMPATEWAWRTSGLAAATAGQFENSAVSTGSWLWFLGDVFAVPRGLPFANVFSAGDVVVVVGLVVMVHLICRRATPAPVVDASSTPLETMPATA